MISVIVKQFSFHSEFEIVGFESTDTVECRLCTQANQLKVFHVFHNIIIIKRNFQRMYFTSESSLIITDSPIREGRMGGEGACVEPERGWEGEEGCVQDLTVIT